MRTSRVSRDTSRVLAASRALRQTRSGANPPVQDASDSELSSVPTDVSSDDEYATPPPKKRRTARDVPVKVKHESKETSITNIASPKKDVKPRKARRVPAKKINGADGIVKVEPPPNWEEIYALTREMRNANLAPVDTMGCESLADRQRSPRDQRFQTLIALMLSSQTKDTVTAVAMRGMQERMPGVCFAHQFTRINANISRASISNRCLL
jgi:endonuclease-3